MVGRDTVEVQNRFYRQWSSWAQNCILPSIWSCWQHSKHLFIVAWTHRILNILESSFNFNFILSYDQLWKSIQWRLTQPQIAILSGTTYSFDWMNLRKNAIRIYSTNHKQCMHEENRYYITFWKIGNPTLAYQCALNPQYINLIFTSS